MWDEVHGGPETKGGTATTRLTLRYPGRTTIKQMALTISAKHEQGQAKGHSETGCFRPPESEGLGTELNVPYRGGQRDDTGQ